MVPCLALPCLVLPCWVEPDRTPKSRSNHSQRPASPTHLDPADCSIITDIWTGPWGSSAFACGHRNGPAGEGGGGASKQTHTLHPCPGTTLTSIVGVAQHAGRSSVCKALPPAGASRPRMESPGHAASSCLDPARPSPAHLPAGFLAPSAVVISPSPARALTPGLARAWRQ